MHVNIQKKIINPVIIMMLAMMLPHMLKAQSSLQKFDDRIMINFANSRTPQETDFMRFMSNTNNYVDIGVPAFLFIDGVASGNRQMRVNSAYIASSTAISFGITTLIKVLVKRPRPFVNNVNIVPVYRASGFSFPSGHSSSSFTTATALSVAYPKWYVIAPAFLWSGTVAYSRMYLGEHYPTDVTAGALLGVSTAYSMKLLSTPISSQSH